MTESNPVLQTGHKLRLGNGDGIHGIGIGKKTRHLHRLDHEFNSIHSDFTKNLADTNWSVGEGKTEHTDIGKYELQGRTGVNQYC